MNGNESCAGTPEDREASNPCKEQAIEEPSLAHYEQRYLAYQSATAKVALMAMASHEVLDRFPVNLPKTLSDPTRELLTWMRSRFTQVLEQLEEGKPLSALAEKQSKNTSFSLTHAIQRAAIELLVAEVMTQKSPLTLDFAPVIREQQLVMMCANLDAFLIDSVKAMYVQHPEALCCEKKWTWERIIKIGSWEALLQGMIEARCFEFGMMTITQKIEYLKDRHGFELRLGSAVIETIHEAENARHLIVHNAGRVSSEYKRRVENSQLDVGEKIRVSKDQVHRVDDAMRQLASDVFAETSAKAFKADEDQIDGIWRRITP